jgi:serine/threonine protein phosphatase PrpC
MSARARGTLVMVADGVGGQASGELASALGVHAVANGYFNSRTGRDPAEVLGDAQACAATSYSWDMSATAEHTCCAMVESHRSHAITRWSATLLLVGCSRRRKPSTTPAAT